MLQNRSGKRRKKEMLSRDGLPEHSCLLDESRDPPLSALVAAPHPGRKKCEFCLAHKNQLMMKRSTGGVYGKRNNHKGNDF